MTDTSREYVERLLDGVTLGPWVVYGEPEVGLPCSLFSGQIGTFDFGPVEPLQGRDLDFVAWCREGVPALLARAEAAEARADAAEAELVGAFEAAAEAVEDLSKLPGTTWGQVKGHIRAMGDVGDRRAYQSLRAALAAERETVARLEAALLDISDSRRLISHGDPGTLRDRARAAITQKDRTDG